MMSLVGASLGDVSFSMYDPLILGIITFIMAKFAYDLYSGTRPKIDFSYKFVPIDEQTTRVVGVLHNHSNNKAKRLKVRSSYPQKFFHCEELVFDDNTSSIGLFDLRKDSTYEIILGDVHTVSLLGEKDFRDPNHTLHFSKEDNKRIVFRINYLRGFLTELSVSFNECLFRPAEECMLNELYKNSKFERSSQKQSTFRNGMIFSDGLETRDLYRLRSSKKNPEQRGI